MTKTYHCFQLLNPGTLSLSLSGRFILFSESTQPAQQHNDKADDDTDDDADADVADQQAQQYSHHDGEDHGRFAAADVGFFLYVFSQRYRGYWLL